MPELPEVETTRRGLAPLVTGKRIDTLLIRQRKLRWPVARGLAGRVAASRIDGVERRGKYLLIRLPVGSLIVHLGMSGSLRYLPRCSASPPSTHDHFDLILDDSSCVRFNDPRRFGSLHFAREPWRHPLLSRLGPEPLGDAFDAAYLQQACHGRKTSIKQLLMNGRVVAGLGNIYATEALFRAGIHPSRAAGRVSPRRLAGLVAAIRDVLEDALAQGGTTLRDFIGSDGQPGYFAIALRVYGRDGDPCQRCGVPIRTKLIGQRASYYCPKCQR